MSATASGVLEAGKVMSMTKTFDNQVAVPGAAPESRPTGPDMARPDLLGTVHDLTQAKARYCLAVDTKDWVALTDLMTPDIELDVSDGNTGVPVITGRDNAVAMIRTALTGARTAHHIHTPLIDAEGDAAHVIWATQDRVMWDSGMSLTGYGHYHERWVRRGGDWRLASLTLTRLITEQSGTTPSPRHA